MFLGAAEEVEGFSFAFLLFPFSLFFVPTAFSDGPNTTLLLSFLGGEEDSEGAVVSVTTNDGGGAEPEDRRSIDS